MLKIRKFEISGVSPKFWRAECSDELAHKVDVGKGVFMTFVLLEIISLGVTVAMRLKGDVARPYSGFDMESQVRVFFYIYFPFDKGIVFFGRDFWAREAKVETFHRIRLAS